MKRFEHIVNDNPLKTRADLEKWTLALLEPVKTVLHRSHTRAHISNMSSGAADSVSEIEGFSRILWALGAIQSLDASNTWWEIIRKGLIHGTDPNHPDYFGDIKDYDQRMVETAAIAYTFILRQECIYDPLNEDEKKRLIHWLNGVNHTQAYPCNWQFFRVMVNLGFKHIGVDYDEKAVNTYLNELDSYYVSDGWYTDGKTNEAHGDYYVPFAMHYYGLFYAMVMAEEDPKRSALYRERAALFAKDFAYWFTADGIGLPYGRSLMYRFAQVAFWSMMVVAEVPCDFTLGEMKGIILRHLRWWNKQPILDVDGFLTMGYVYPNQFMTEEYNAPGSVYWAMKTMIILALEEDHAFWQEEEAPLPSLATSTIQNTPRLVIHRDQLGKHVIAYNGGNTYSNGHMHVEAKYQKFTYSTHFGFSVPRSHKTLRFGAYDCTLAVSTDGQYYRHKEESSWVQIAENTIKTHWSPMPGVKIQTSLICGFPWHIRIHKIITNQELIIAEGGYALGMEGQTVVNLKTGDLFAEIASEIDYSGIKGYRGYDECELVYSAANTNIMNPRAAIPTLKGHLSAGTHFCVCLVYGDLGSIEALELPEVQLSEDYIKMIHKPELFMKLPLI